jgi:hypothetical protein
MGSNRTVQQSPAGTCFLVSSLDNEVFICKSVLQIVCGHSAALTPTIEVHLKKRGLCRGCSAEISDYIAPHGVRAVAQISQHGSQVRYVALKIKLLPCLPNPPSCCTLSLRKCMYVPSLDTIITGTRETYDYVAQECARGRHTRDRHCRQNKSKKFQGPGGGGQRC